MPNNYNVRTVTRPAKPRSKVLQGLLAGTLSGSSAPGGLLPGYVTLSTPQTITAPKTFAEDVTFGAAREDGTYSRLLIPSSSGPGIYSLYVSTEPVDGEAPSASGGIDEDELWTILGGSSTSKVIDPGHIPVIPVEKVSGLSTALSSYATKEWVEGKGYLTSVSLSTISDLHASWDSLLQSAPDFYSKGSVYSKSEADGRFVGIANEQTVTGRKTFSALLTASGGISGSNADLSGYLSAAKLYLPYSGGSKVYDICISTQPIDGEAPSEGGGINEDELWTILGGSGTQKIGASHIPPLSELDGNLDSSRITGLDSALTGYVKKAGDTMTGWLQISSTDVPFVVDSSNSIETAIQIKRNGTYKAVFGYYDGLGAFMYNWQSGHYLNLTDGGGLQLSTKTNTIGNIWHSGNDGSGSGLDADLLDGYHGRYYLRSFWTASPGYDASQYVIDSFSTFTYSNKAPYTGPLFHLGASGYGVYFNTAYNYDSPLSYKRHGQSGDGGMGSWQTLARITDNVASATKLQTSRTLWGRPFDGTGNVSGDMTGVGSITASSYIKAANFIGNYISDNSVNYWVGDAANGAGSGKSGLLLYAYGSRNIYLYTNSEQRMVVNASGNVGIGTTSPAYKLDVAGEIRATSGITIGSASDIGWYNYNGRLVTCVGNTIGINVYNLLVSNYWSDYTKVPTNGIYSKGDIWTGGKLYIPSSSGNNVFDAYIA